MQINEEVDAVRAEEKRVADENIISEPSVVFEEQDKQRHKAVQTVSDQIIQANHQNHQSRFVFTFCVCFLRICGG